MAARRGRGPHLVTLDPEGNRDKTTTPKGQTTTTLHDELGKPFDLTQPPFKAGETALVTRFRYDENRNLVRMEDQDGRVTKLEYDELNRLFKTTRDPGGLALTSETTDFDADGHPLRIAEANGEVTRQSWDELGRLKTRTFEAPASGWTAPWQYTTEERNSYDPNSNLERIEEYDVRSGGGTPPVRVTTRGYDRLDRQTSETVTLQDGSTRSVTTEYYKDGRVKSVTDPQGVTSYSYDGQGREETVTTSAGETRKTYYPDSLVKDITFPNGTKRAHSYDKADRLLSIVTTKGAVPVASTAYSYDPNGNRLTQVQRNGGVEETTSYSYDDLDRLGTVTYAPDAGHANGRTVTYGHDGAGNRKTEVVTDPVTLAVLESRTGVFDRANRLTSLTDNLDAGQTTTLAWDRNGNLLSETRAGVTTSYRYDLRDTLAEVERGAQTLARFLGDFDERRVLKIGDPTRPGGSGVQEYVYDGSRLILDVENGLPVSRYEWTNEELVSLLQSGGQRRYFALDGLETVMALTDEAGQAVDRLNFDAWGVPKAGTDFGTSGSRFAFTSHRFDTELNLYYAGGRMYSPTIGRFISQDNLSLDPNNPETWNLYSYARSNPTRYVDPTGHYVESAIEIASIGVGAFSLKNNIQRGNWWGAAGDVLGIGVDAVALAVPFVPGGAGLAIKGARAYKAAQTVDLANNTGQAIGGAGEAFAEGKGLKGAFMSAMAALGFRGTGKVGTELAADAQKASTNLSEAGKAGNVTEKVTADAAAPVPGARVDSGTKPVADSVVPPPPAKQPAAEAGGGGGGRPVDDAPRTGDGSGRGSPDQAPSSGSGSVPSTGPGSAAHKATRWEEYQARGGAWSYGRWSKVYEQNMGRAARANKAADAFHEGLGWGRREVTVDVEGVPRRLDIADEATLRGREVKTGYQSATQQNLWEVQRDEILREKGWDIQWHFEGPVSRQLREALEKAGIPFTGGKR